MGNGEVHARFVLTLCVFDFDFSILYFCLPIGNSHCFLITQGVIKNIILSCFNLYDQTQTNRRANCFYENL